MTPEKIKKEINKYKWAKWLERDFGAFVVSVFTQPEGMKNIDIDVEMPSFVSQGGFWYSSNEIMEKSADDLKDWFEKNHKTIFDITSDCQKFYLKSKKQIEDMVESGKTGKEDMIKLLDIFRISTNYIWVTHSLEEMYMKELRNEIPKYWKGDPELFIGDISFPKKKNSYIVFQEKLKTGESLERLAKEYGWLNVRNGFDDQFTVHDLELLREKLRKEPERRIKRVKVPKQIKELVEEVRELVFFRTYRTDVFFELLFLARPVIKRYGESLGIDFKDIRNYRMDELVDGIIKKYPKWVTCVQYKNSYAFFDGNAVTVHEEESKQIKGSIAFMGFAKGIARIVKSVKDLPNVKEGDILVTNMTTPNFLIAMKKAVAFVTDEGGITCHAAIVAREMQKPCIIGTKIATKVLKDGDLVEVDANKGVVRIIKKR